MVEGGMGMGSNFPLAAPIHTFITVGDVEEKVLFMMLLRKTEKKIVGVTLTKCKKGGAL